MSDSPKALTRSIGRPFWIGCLVGPILFIICCAPILRDSNAFYIFGGIAVIVFGPVGGAIFQAAHDLFVARRSGLLHLWDFLVFTAIGIALVVAGETLYYGYGKQTVDPFKNHTFAIAAALVLLTLLIYAISKHRAEVRADFFSRQTWIAILLTIGLTGVAIGVYRLTGFDIGWILVPATAVWAAIDSSKIRLKRYKSGISYGPIPVFFGFIFLWEIAIPWYLIVRHKIKTGQAVLKDEAETGG